MKFAQFFLFEYIQNLTVVACLSQQPEMGLIPRLVVKIDSHPSYFKRLDTLLCCMCKTLANAVPDKVFSFRCVSKVPRNTLFYRCMLHTATSFEPVVVLCSVSVIPLQHRSCKSFVRPGHHNG